MGSDDADEPIDELETIEEIIQDELQTAKQAEPIKLSDEAARQSEAAHKISNAIFELIKAGPVPYFLETSVTEALNRLIKRTGLSNGFAHSTFQYIELMLQDALAKQDEDSKDAHRIASAIESLNFVAVRYFEVDLVEELKDVHIAEILQRSKATLARLETFDQKYFRQAVENVKEDAERRIELRKEEKLNRDQMYEPDADRKEDFRLENEEKPDSREKRQKDRGLTRENAYIFIDYLLEHAIKGTSLNPNIKDRADVVEFLTGYSAVKLKEVPAWLKRERAKIQEKEEVGEKIFNEMQQVRKLFEKLGLEEIAERIDQDLGESS